MNRASTRSRRIVLEIDEDTYKKLVEKAEKEGYSVLADYILHILRRALTAEYELPVESVLEKLKSRVKRIVEDEMGRFLEMVNELKNRVADLHDRVESLATELENLKKQIETTTTVEAGKRRERKTGIERLREEKVVFESNLPPRISKDRLFNYLEREGAVVLRLSRERIAVDPEYWREFKKKLFEEISTNDEEIIRRVLGSPGYELFLKLREESLIYFDSKQKKWLASVKELLK